MSKQKKRNIPLIVIGIIILIAVTPYVGKGGSLIPILQVCGLIVVLIGFGVPWKRSKQKKSHKGILKPANIDDYVASVGVLSARTATQIQEKNPLNDRQSSEIMVQLAIFNILMLVRDMENASVPTGNAAVFVDKTLRELAVKLNSDIDENTAYTLLKQLFTELSDQFGSLPLTSDSDILGGTLLWEYSKHMNETMGKEALDLEMIMHNTATLTYVREALDTSAAIQFANTLDNYKDGYKKYL
ncbi:MAG: hypothetical protein EOM45_04325 [Clostridia bacterium]|nr:hypothetical protein [Clostridia bacterium]